MSLSRTRRSLLYPAMYLTGSGLGMTIAPDWTLAMLGSNGHYAPAIVRFAGVFVLGLAAIVIQTIRLGLDPMYRTLIGVRVGFCAAYVALYLDTRDPFFLVVLGVVGAGLIASSLMFAADRRTEE
jgi:hypothetical protein